MVTNGFKSKHICTDICIISFVHCSLTKRVVVCCDDRSSVDYSIFVFEYNVIFVRVCIVLYLYLFSTLAYMMWNLHVKYNIKYGYLGK